MLRTTASRLAAVTAAVLVAGIAAAGPAFAHVEVSAENARALAQNVTVEFESESESDSAGIIKAQVFLPKGIAPVDVTYKEGPKGWKLTRDDTSITVSGPAVAVGENAEFAVTVRQLPDVKSLAFKTLQSYSDGRVDRWIGLQDNSEHPAPVLKLAAAAPGATPLSPSPTAGATAPSASPSSPSSAEPSDPATAATGAGGSGAEDAQPASETTADEGGFPVLPVALGVVVLALAGGGVWWWQRRRTTTGDS